MRGWINRVAFVLAEKINDNVLAIGETRRLRLMKFTRTAAPWRCPKGRVLRTQQTYSDILCRTITDSRHLPSALGFP